MGSYAVELDQVWFSYGEKVILKDINLHIKQGEFTAIIGPNGGGKTTLLNIMLGILKPDRGTVKILGSPPHEANHRIGYVPQGIDIKRRFPISVMDVALMGRLSRSKPGRGYKMQDREKAEDVLKMVGLWNYRYEPIYTLSGGQLQRLFIARALATDPEILFLDEPTSHVDPEFQIDLYDFLKELNKRVTIIVITHDIGVVSRYIKSIACVNRHLIFHEEGKITREMIDMAYRCPVDLVAHGLPHRVLPEHERE